MQKVFSRIYHEIVHNIIIAIAIIVGILGVIQVLPFEITSAAILVTLGLIATSLLSLRKASDVVRNSNDQVVADLENLSVALFSPPKVSDVFVSGYPDLSKEVESARNIKIFSIGLATIDRYYFQFVQMLSNGGSIQILVSDTSDNLMEILAFRSSSVREPEKYENLVSGNLERFQILHKHAVDGTKLEFREIPYFPTFGMFIIEDRHKQVKIHTQLVTMKIHTQLVTIQVFNLWYK